ncbi:MAG: NAD(+) synthase [Defluviitaleaceae bacterium]|nr:NAD(+) synthase [Defluviitaleaceae bacterium]
MRDYKKETSDRVAFIRRLVADAKVNGIVFNNSGGKDAALVGILCKMACDDTLGLILPCGVRRNYADDRDDALLLGERYYIPHRVIDLLPVREALTQTMDMTISDFAYINIAPRLRMTALYAVANSENRLAAGTGNRSERHMGYFTKWGDGAYDFNPIADLTATEAFEFLRYLQAPEAIINKAPSAGLFEGQTDESEMGITYEALDTFLTTGKASESDRAVINRFHAASAHKRTPPVLYGAADGDCL